MHDIVRRTGSPTLSPSGARRAAGIETPSPAARPRFPHRQRENRLRPASNTLCLFGLSGLLLKWSLKGRIGGRSDGLLRNDRGRNGWKAS